MAKSSKSIESDEPEEVVVQPEIPEGYASLNVPRETISLVVGALPEDRRRACFYREPTLIVPADLFGAATAALGSGPELALAAARTARNVAINERREAILADGYRHNFGGSAGIRTLDTRNERDAINWLGLERLTDRLLQDDAGSTQIELRDASDATFSASAATVSAAMFGMANWRGSVMARSWALKDKVGAAATPKALAAIDIEAGWPE